MLDSLHALRRMSDASDEIQVDAPAEVEAPTEAPKGKLSVEDALQVRTIENTDICLC